MQKEGVDKVSLGGEGPEVHSLAYRLFPRSVFFFFRFSGYGTGSQVSPVFKCLLQTLLSLH